MAQAALSALLAQKMLLQHNHIRLFRRAFALVGSALIVFLAAATACDPEPPDDDTSKVVIRIGPPDACLHLELVSGKREMPLNVLLQTLLVFGVDPDRVSFAARCDSMTEMNFVCLPSGKMPAGGLYFHATGPGPAEKLCEWCGRLANVNGTPMRLDRGRWLPSPDGDHLFSGSQVCKFEVNPAGHTGQ